MSLAPLAERLRPRGERHISPVSPGGIAPAGTRLGNPAVSGAAHAVSRRPETTASRVRILREFRPEKERSDRTGHSRYCEPARHPYPAGCPRQKVSVSKPEYEKDVGSARRGRAWQSSKNLHNWEAPKTAIARLRWKCDLRDKRLDPSGGANASLTREGRPC